MIVRGLTVPQPYASLIAHGVKTVESRSWQPAPEMFDPGIVLLIRAGRDVDPEAIKSEPIREALVGRCALDPDDLPRSAVIAVVNAYRAGPWPAGLALQTAKEQAPYGDLSEGRFLWFLSTVVERLPEPVKCKTGRHLWEPEEQTITEVVNQLPASIWLRGWESKVVES